MPLRNEEIKVIRWIPNERAYLEFPHTLEDIAKIEEILRHSPLERDGEPSYFPALHAIHDAGVRCTGRQLQPYYEAEVRRRAAAKSGGESGPIGDAAVDTDATS